MDDAKGLFFIKMITKAFEDQDPEGSLKEAFREIQRLGNHPDYEQGFRQFQRFIQSTIDASTPWSTEMYHRIQNAVNELVYELATDTFEGSEEQKTRLISLITSHPKWHTEYDRIKEELKSTLGPQPVIEIEIIRDNETIASKPLAQTEIMIKGITPGLYQIGLSTGMLLWEGQLAEEDLIWSSAFPERDLPMAAETELSDWEPTKIISILDGEIVIHIFAGLESGEIKIIRTQDSS